MLLAERSYSERNYVEQRDFIRMYVDARVDVSDPISGLSFSGEGRTLSGSGMSFVSDRPVTLGSVIKITLSTRNSKLPPLHADLKVVRMQLLDNGRYDIAGELSNIS